MSPEEQQLLLSDAIDRVAANPTASHLWLHLMPLMRRITDPALMAQVVRAISIKVNSEGLGGFYRAAVLDLSTDNPAFLPQACDCLQAITPPDLDRYAAFFDTAWQRVLLYVDDRADYTRRLTEVGLPRLAMRIGQRLARYVPAGAPRSNPPTRPRRVAVVAPQLASPAHPPTLVALDQALTLIQQGVEVSLFSCQEAMVPDLPHLLGTGTGTPPLQPDLRAWLEGAGAKVDVHLSDTRVSMVRRWLDMLGRIDAYAPDLVLFVGLHSGLMPLLHQRYPVLGLAVNSIAPMVPTDAWLTAQAGLADTVSHPWDDGFPSSMACYHPFRMRRTPAAEPLPRAGLAIDADAVLCMTMGSHLDVKITGEWAQRMCAAMARHPKLVWLLVGGDATLPPALAALPPERLRLLPYTPQAMRWLVACDLYLHPPIMGGGFSVAEAMSRGVPALALAGADGGDKTGAEALADFDAYFARLDALAGDAPLRRASGERMRAHFDTMLDLAASGPSLMAACGVAMRRQRQRATSGELTSGELTSGA